MLALRETGRSLDRDLEQHVAEEGERGQAAREALARDAAAFCQGQIARQVKPPSRVRFEAREERFGYDPARGEALVVGALDALDGGASARHEYVCRLKRQGGSWLALLAAIR